MDSDRMPVHSEATTKGRKRNRKKTSFLSASQIDKQAATRTKEVDRLPPGEARVSALRGARLFEPQSFSGRRNGVADGGN
jgi:hypothetical protein